MIFANQDVVIKRSLGKDKYGEPLGFQDYPVKARVVNEIRKVTNQAGEEVVSNMTILIMMDELKASNGVKYDDELSFTDEFGNTTSRKPQNVSPARGLSSSPSFVRVFV